MYASTNVCKALLGNKCDQTEERVVDFLTAKVSTIYSTRLLVGLCHLKF